MSDSIKVKRADLQFAFEQAVSFLRMEEWPEDDGGQQNAAYREAARIIEEMMPKLLAARTKP